MEVSNNRFIPVRRGLGSLVVAIRPRNLPFSLACNSTTASLLRAKKEDEMGRKARRVEPLSAHVPKVCLLLNGQRLFGAVRGFLAENGESLPNNSPATANRNILGGFQRTS